MTTTLHDIEWFAADEYPTTTSWVAYYEGIEAVVTESESTNANWFWVVRPTGKRSEFPEVYDCGHTRTAETAKRHAEIAVRRANKSYGWPRY